MSMATNNPTVLITCFLGKTLAEQIEQRFKTYKLWEQTDQSAFLKNHGHEITAVATGAFYGAQKELIDKLPNVKIIANFGVGYDSVDVSYATQKGVIVTNTPNVLNECVADLTIGLLLDISRKISEADRFIRAGLWQQGKPFKAGVKPSGKKCGIVGLGRIGKAIAKRAEAFNMEIAYFGRHKQQDSHYTYYDNVAELAKAVDFLIIVVPGGAQTKHLIDSAVLAALGSKGYLINIARGSVVDEAALLQALQTNQIAGAALDVYANEPQVPDALLQLDNVVLTPHIGSYTIETRRAMGDLVFDNLESFLTGKGAITPVN